MIKEVRRIKDLRKQRRIYGLMYRHKLKKYAHNGRVAYDTDELRAYDKTAQRGRPIKFDE